MFQFEYYQLLVLLAAVCLTGLSKGGFAGVGMIATPLLATVMDPLLAVSIMLPILIVQDALSVLIFRRTISWPVLRNLLPGAAVGIGIGYLLAAWLNAAVVSGLIGVISILFAGYFLLAPKTHAPSRAAYKSWVGIICGAGSGFTSMIAHAGTPPFQIYTLPMRMPRDLFVGTSVFFFAMVNLIKVPPYLLLGQLSVDAIKISALMVPASLLATAAGVWLVRRIDTDRFYTIICVLLGLVGARLTYSACVEVFG